MAARELCRFSDELKAARFERYLKSGSGHAFTNTHRWSRTERFRWLCLSRGEFVQPRPCEHELLAAMARERLPEILVGHSLAAAMALVMTAIAILRDSGPR